MQQLSANEIARATVLYSIRKITNVYVFTYYGKCGDKNGILFQYSITESDYNNFLETKGLNSIIEELEKNRSNPLEAIYKIERKNKDDGAE